MLAMMAILFSIWGLSLGVIAFIIATIVLLWLRLVKVAIVVGAIGLAYFSAGVVYRAGEEVCLARMQAQHEAVLAAETQREAEAKKVDRARDELLAKYVKQIEAQTQNKCPLTKDDADRINNVR